MRFIRFVLLALVVLVVVAGIVAWTCPADFAYQRVSNRFGPVRLNGVSGTIWHGHAATMEIFGQPIGTLDWDLQPAPILHGSAIAMLHVVGPGLVATSTVERAMGKSAVFSDATINVPARFLAAAIDIPALQLNGQVEIKIDKAHLSGIWFDDVQGQAHWRNASVTGAAQADFGEIESKFASTPDGAIAGTVHDTGGMLIADGTFRAVVGSYEAQARLAARDGNPQVTEALQYIGQAQSDGSVVLLIRGRMFNLF
jgi:general secretion pathway protein N